MQVDTERLLAELRRLIDAAAAGRGTESLAGELAAKVLALSSALDHLHARLDQILEVVTAMTALDFERKIEVREEDDWLVNGIVIGLNMLGDELRRRAEALTETRDRALAATRAKSSFLANMSHELRTPLNAIIGYSELLREESQGVLPDHLVADLDKIVTAGRHLLSLIKDTLDLSKIEAGKLELTLEAFALDPLVDEVVGTVRPLVVGNENRLVVERDAALGEIRSDRTKLLQILLNLLSNAIKFTTLGTIRLVVARAGDQLTFVVEDTGIGIQRDKLDVIFGAFNQADEDITRRFGGAGLGLAITRHFCEMIGGEISVESEIGSGSTFTLRLPAHFDVDRGATRSATAKAPVSSCATVLVVSDDPTLLEALSQLAAGLGSASVHVTHAAAALQIADLLRPALIVLDDRLGEHQLVSTVLALRDDPGVASIPRVIVGEVPDAARGEPALQRPLRREAVLAALGQHLRAPPPLGDLVVVAARTTLLDRAVLGRRWRIHDAPLLEAVRERLQRGADAILLDLAHPQAVEVAGLVRRQPRALPLIGLGDRRAPGADACTAVLPPTLGLTQSVLEALAFARLAAPAIPASELPATEETPR